MLLLVEPLLKPSEALAPDDVSEFELLEVSVDVAVELDELVPDVLDELDELEASLSKASIQIREPGIEASS